MVVIFSPKSAAPLRLKCSNNILFLGFAFVLFNLIWLNFRISTPTTTIPPTSSIPRMPLDHPLPVRRKKQKTRIPDGTFNGYPVYFHEQENNISSSLYTTTSHCVGENYQSKWSWMHRSCHYSFLCFDIEQQDFVVFEPPNEKLILPFLKENPHMDVSQGYLRLGLNGSENFLSLGGINQKWTMNKDGAPRLKWSPRVLQEPPTSFYSLPLNVTMIPFHSLSGSNPGHLVWDDFLPVYTLMSMFGLQDQEPLMIRYVLPDGRGLWASCDVRDENRKTCLHMHNKFWPIMNKNNHSKLTSNLLAEWHAPMNKSKYICARHGLAGIGSLTDHGTKKGHGWEVKDYHVTHNHGRGGLFWDFRMFAMNNIGFVDQPLKPPYKIVYSIASSKMAARIVDFSKQIEVLKSSLDPSEAVVETYTFKKFSLREQVKIASEAAIFVTACGGGAVTGTFIQRGSSIFIYYKHNGGVKNNRHSEEPARLDWDLFNNIGYARVHWMRKDTAQQPEDLDAFVQLVKNELNRIKLGDQ